MTNSATIETVDQKLEHIVSVLVRMADERSDFRREMQQSLRESDQRMTRLEATLQEVSQTTREQSEVARIQAESVRELIRLLNERRA